MAEDEIEDVTEDRPDYEAALERVMSRVEESRKAEQETILAELQKHLNTDDAPTGQPVDDLPDENMEFKDYMRTYKEGIMSSQAQATAELLQFTKIATDEARTEVEDLVADGVITKERGAEIMNTLHQALLADPSAVARNVKSGHHLGFIARMTHDDLKKARKAAKESGADVITGAGTGSVKSTGGADDPRSQMKAYLKERGYDLDPEVAKRWEN